MASGHYTYLSSITPDPDVQKLLTGAAIAVGLIALARYTIRRLPRTGIPDERLTLSGFVMWAFEAYVRYHDSVLAKENRKYVPFTGSIFFFVLAANLVGLIPGMAVSTTTVRINVGLALAVFLYFNYVGIRSQGLVTYLKHFAGPVWWLAFFLLPLELFSTVIRIFTLNLRLYWNVTADHLVLEIATSMVSFLLPVAFYGLGAFVSFMQAFVFATLTMLYIAMALPHGDDHHEKASAH